MIEWSQKSLPKKIPRASNNPPPPKKKKIRGPKISPQEIPCRISEPYIVAELGGRDLVWALWRFFRLFWIAKPPKKILESTISNPPKFCDHPCHLKSGVPPPPPGFFGVFWSENGYRLCLSGMIFEGTTVEYERIYYFSSKWLRKKEKYANLKWVLTILFCCCSNLSNDDIFS